MKTKKIDLIPAQTVLVIGGNGFIGQHVVKHLEIFGAHVIIGTRGNRPFREAGAQKIRLHKLTEASQIDNLLNGVDVVINAVGILRQRPGETYEQIHHHSVSVLAEACAIRSIRFVHISALGLNNPVKSRFAVSKLRGEKAIMSSRADWHIVRPSLVDGEGGYGAKWFRRVAVWPVHFIPKSAVGKFTPIDANDLGEAVAKIALNSEQVDDKDRIYEVGGASSMTFSEYLDVLSPRVVNHKFHVPTFLARCASHLGDLFYLTPYSFGHHELLKFDNIPGVNRLDYLLGREARSIKATTGPLCTARSRIGSDGDFIEKNNFENYHNPRIDIPGNDGNALNGKVYLDPTKALWVSFMLIMGTLGSALTISFSAVLLFVCFTAVTLCLGHSLGMHRRFIHRSYECPKWLEVLFVHLGTLVGLAGPMGMLRTHDLRDWAQRQTMCHDYFSHGKVWYHDLYWQLFCSIRLEEPPLFEPE